MEGYHFLVEKKEDWLFEGLGLVVAEVGGSGSLLVVGRLPS